MVRVRTQGSAHAQSVLRESGMAYYNSHRTVKRLGKEGYFW